MSKPTTPIEPIAIIRTEHETDLEYNLRLAAAFIEAHCADKPVLHEDYDEDEPVTGQELVNSLIHLAEQLREDYEKDGSSMTLTGTIIQAGTDDESGKPSITIHTNEHQLKSQKSIPFYRPCEIRFTPISTR